MSQIIDGKALAKGVVLFTKRGVEYLAEHGALSPGLAVILVGEDPASTVYVKSKIKTAKDAGILSFLFQLPQDVSQDKLLELIDSLNARQDIHGILLQLPLPPHLHANEAIERIDPQKDVDGLHPLNLGYLASHKKGTLPLFVPCTPLACLLILNTLPISLGGARVVIVGRSNLVGKPLFHVLNAYGATCTVVHTQTPSPETLTIQADILVAAAGSARLIKAHWVKEGAVVVDVGIHREFLDEHTSRLCGDVDFESVQCKTSFITPVPGGVGPMTVACLLYNTYKSACAHGGFRMPTLEDLCVMLKVLVSK